MIDEKNENHKVEFQMKDLGAMGYAKRETEIYYLTNYFYVVLSEKYDQRNFLGYKWKKIDKDINELKLKY